MEDVLKILKDIEQKVLEYNLIGDTDKMNGKVMESVKTFNLDETKYITVKATDNTIICASCVKCGDEISFNSIPAFNLKDIAIEEVDFGLNHYSGHILIFIMKLVACLRRIEEIYLSIILF